MEHDNPYSGMIEDPASVEERRSVARSVASRSPCDAQERTSVAAPVTEVVPPPSVCSTADGPPRRTSPPPSRHPPLTRTPVPVEQRIMFKVLLITFKALNDKAPSYIRDMLVLRQNQRQLRSSSQTLLSMPKSRLRTAGDRTFSYQAALLWNALPESLRTLTAVDPFKRHLKTYLFQIAYA